jgi:hypothetical protein
MGYRYKITEDYFNNINNEYKAYILGFIYADGSIYQPPGNRQMVFRIGIVQEDEYILEKLSKEAAGGHKHIVKTPSSIKKNYKPQILVNISSNKLCQDLINLGCNINKSKVGMKFPKLKKDLIPHFIRGFLDGDGSIILKKLKYSYKRKTSYKLKNPHKQQYKLKIAFSCTDKDFLLEIANHLNVKYYISERKKLSIIYTLWIENKEEVNKVISYLYDNSTYFLSRKYNKVIEFNKTIKSEAEGTPSERLETT